MPPDKRQAITIIGIVDNAVDQSLRSEAFPTLYQPLVQFTTPLPLPEFSLSVRAASGSPALLARSITSTLAAIDKNLAFGFHVLTDQISAARQQERLVAWLAGFFGFLALLLAALGLRGVTLVHHRAPAHGDRHSHGARCSTARCRRARAPPDDPHDRARCPGGRCRGGCRVRAICRRCLFGVTPLDPITFIAAPTLLIAVALYASYLPARRATTTDPMIALRCE